MKIVLLLVSVITVFTFDSRGFPDKPGDGDPIEHGPDSLEEHRSADQDQLFPGESVDEIIVDDSQIIHKQNKFSGRSSEIIQQIMKEGKVKHERGLRGSPQCSANAICGIVGGSCIGNTTTCSGWQVSEGCKGSCKCCIPRSQEMQMTIFTLELQWLKEDLVNSSLQLKANLLAMIENVNSTNAELKEQLDTKLDSMDAKISNQGCREDTFWHAESDQCFKFLNKTKYKWEDANKACKDDGLELAKPYDPLSLRSYVVSRYAPDTATWIGARGTGSITKWQRDGQAISTNSNHWYSGQHGKVASSSCLRLMTHPGNLKTTTPYYMVGCTNSYWALCEFVRK